MHCSDVRGAPEGHVHKSVKGRAYNAGEHTTQDWKDNTVQWREEQTSLEGHCSAKAVARLTLHRWDSRLYQWDSRLHWWDRRLHRQD